MEFKSFTLICSNCGSPSNVEVDIEAIPEVCCLCGSTDIEVSEA